MTADTLKKLVIAPNNETYVLNTMRFVGILDAENKKAPEAGAVFNQHDDSAFQEGLSGLVSKAYHELFALHGEGSWSLDLNKLISFFRTHDGTSDVVGKRQAGTFQTLAKLSGKLNDTDPPVTAGATKAIKLVVKKQSSSIKKVASMPPAPQPPASVLVAHSPEVDTSQIRSSGGVALTVRIEINLPSGGDQAMYDAIFKSIRENLMNGNGS